jgi:hypothetical protein
MAGNEHTYETGSRDFNVIVDHYGDAKGTKSEFKDSQPEKINTLIAGIYRTNRFAYETLQPELEGIKADIIACWQGENADKALNIVATLSTDASTIGDNTRKCGDALSTFQSDWITLKGQAGDLYEGVAGTGFHQDNDGAHRIYDAFTKSMDTAMHTMPSELVYHTPLSSDKYDHVTGPGGPGPGGPGPGGFGPGTGPGGIGPGTGPGIGPGTGPGIGPGTGPGYGPGTGPGGIGPGGIGPGTGVDTGAGLAGFDGGGAGGFGAGDASGVGPGGGIGPGSGIGAGGGGAGLSGGGAGGGAGLVGGGAGAGGAGAAAAGGRGMMPMYGGQGGDEEERERSTWLTEDDDIWGGEDGLPPVLQ